MISKIPTELLKRFLHVFTIILILFGTSCQNSPSNEGDKQDSVNTSANTKAPDTSNAFSPGPGKFFKTLKLEKSQVETLFANNQTRKLIFQFYYPLNPNDLPGLIAYASQNRNVLIRPIVKENLVELDPSLPTTPPAEIVLGDQQVDKQEILNLIRESTTADPGVYEYLLFLPQYNPDTDHIFYMIFVRKTGQAPFTKKPEPLDIPTRSTNPSPPEDAF
jgi:hypothetical protein